MTRRQLKRLAAKVDKANAIQESIEELESALDLIENSPGTMVNIAVCKSEFIIPISEHIKFSNDIWREIISIQISQLRMEFKNL